MVAVSLIVIFSLLVGFFYIRSFILHTGKVSKLKSVGIPAEATIVEVRNENLATDSGSKSAKISFRFLDTAGATQIVNYKKQLAAGEIIGVGAPVNLTYLEADPRVFDVPELKIKASSNWVDLITGFTVMLIGLFAAYVVYINLDTNTI